MRVWKITLCWGSEKTRSIPMGLLRQILKKAVETIKTFLTLQWMQKLGHITNYNFSLYKLNS